MAVYTDNGTNTPNGSHLEFTYTFPTIKTDGTDVKVALNGQTQATNKYTVTTSSPTKITFNNTNVDSTLQESTGAPKTGVTVRVYRDTYVDAAEAVYAAGSSIRAADLNNNQDQVLYALQEEQQLQINSEDIATGAINSTHIKDGTIAAADIANDAIDSQHYAAGSIDLEHMSANSVGENQYVDDSIKTAHISNDQIDSQHYAAGSIDLEHMAANSVDTSKIVNLTIVNEDISNAANIAQSKLALDNELTELATMSPGTASALADLTQTEVEILDGVTATTAELNYVDGVTSNVQTQLDAKQAADAELTELATMHTDTASALADLTQAEVQILDGATVSTTELNKLAGYTGTAADLNELNGLDKQTTITDDDAKFPTSGAVVDYVAAQLEPFGGFEIIANRTSFPNTQPASGVAISITDANGIVFDSTSTPDTTTGNCKTAGNTNVTVQAAPDALQGKTIGAGVGMLVSSTGSGQNYTFHRLLAKDDDVEQLSQDINDFKARYRVADNEAALTGTDDEGDLYFDKGTNKMYVYDGSSWGEVTSTGDFKYLVLSAFNTGTGNAPTFDGSISKYDLRENSTSGSLASVTSAAQLMVSVNGVVQKPNTGTSIGSNDGFCMVDGHTIEFGANIPSNSEVFVVQSGSALAVNVVGDSTVTEAKLNLTGGSNGEFLKKDSTAAGGFVWGAVPAGVGGATGVDFNDDVKARFGTGNDLEIYHDGSNSYIKDTGTGALRINASSVSFNNPGGTEAIAGFSENGAVELFYDNVKKIETTATGVTVTGTVAATAYTGDGSALTGVASATADGCIYENSQTISNNYTIASGKGAHSVGPITVNATVTVNGNWVVS